MCMCVRVRLRVQVDIRQLFRQCDLDGNGKIQYGELFQAMKRVPQAVKLKPASMRPAPSTVAMHRSKMSAEGRREAAATVLQAGLRGMGARRTVRQQLPQADMTVATPASRPAGAKQAAKQAPTKANATSRAKTPAEAAATLQASFRGSGTRKMVRK